MLSKAWQHKDYGKYSKVVYLVEIFKKPLYLASNQYHIGLTLEKKHFIFVVVMFYTIFIERAKLSMSIGLIHTHTYVAL